MKARVVGVASKVWSGLDGLDGCIKYELDSCCLEGKLGEGKAGQSEAHTNEEGLWKGCGREGLTSP